jgi:phenylacetate-CoA ligase
VLGRHAALSRDAVLAAQRAQLRRLVRHAYDAVPFYRERLDRSGLRPEAVAGPADLARLPVVTKRELRGADPRALVARGLDPARLVVHRTSGWSGEPVVIRRTWLEERLYGAARRRAMREFGLRPGDQRAAIGLVGRGDPNDRQWPQRLVRALGLFRRTRLDTLLPPAALAAALTRLAPDVVTGYPGVLAQVARALPLPDGSRPRPRLVITGGEVLTPPDRAGIARGFLAPVFELYGSHECPLIAWQCGRGHGLHVWDPGVVLEVLADGRPARPGERGEVVVTPLHSLAMPFLRYALGDVVLVGESPCPCGAPFSTLAGVQGRMLDYFPLPDGRLLHPYELVVPVLDAAGGWLGQYRLLQEATDRVRLTVVPARPPSSDEVTRLEAALAARLGPRVAVQVALVPEIRLEPSGKFRVSRSLVAADRG